MWMQDSQSSADSSLSFDSTHLEKMIPGIHCFNRQEYWDCHEELEHCWLEDRQDPARYVYWAVIQVAAAMVHYGNNNLIGCVGLMKKAREKFQKARELHVVTPLVLEKLDWVELEQLALSMPENPETIDSFEPLWLFRFKKFME
jgi:uncharacterized protein